jgi:hypothetical protein
MARRSGETKSLDSKLSLRLGNLVLLWKDESVLSSDILRKLLRCMNILYSNIGGTTPLFVISKNNLCGISGAKLPRIQIQRVCLKRLTNTLHKTFVKEASIYSSFISTS